MKTKVDWLEWEKQSFDKAKKEGKPVLLDLTAVWCHWCHVMDATSYSDDEIAEIINKDFIPVKVYIDKRPDIRERYNMGGFPSTVFLAPSGHVITGYTYVPPERLKLLLESVKNAYKNKKSEIEKNIIELKNKKSTDKKNQAKKVSINESMINDILLSVEDNFDRFYGGFGSEPKFPSPEVIDLLFIQYKKTKNEKYLGMALKTLDGMHNGIYDKFDFGFFRYSVTQDWKLPHYEKMLDTNAGLLRNYANAFYITNNEKYKKIVFETLSYLSKFLSDKKNSGYYGSQDADEEFYHLNPDERKNKQYPLVDKIFYVDWNSMMISSYVKAGASLNEKKIIEFGVKTADFFLDKCYKKNSGLFHYYDGKANVSGILSDNIYFLNSLIDIYLATQDEKYLDKIKGIADFILKSFYDGKSGAFFDRIIDNMEIGMLQYPEKSFLENSFCAIVFLRLYFLTKQGKYKDAAEKTLEYFGESYLKYGYFASNYAIAADMLLNDEIKVDILGKKEMLNICIAANNPRVVVNYFEKNDKKNPGYSVGGAYVCKGTLCKGPFADIEKLKEELD